MNTHFKKWWYSWWKHDSITQTLSPLEISNAAWNAALTEAAALVQTARTPLNMNRDEALAKKIEALKAGA